MGNCRFFSTVKDVLFECEVKALLNFLISGFNSFGQWFVRNILDTLKTMRLIDVVDIIVLATLLYFLFRFARKRRAIRLITGVAVFWVVMLIGDAMQLKALNFIFGDFRTSGLLAILILFQPEFRSALEKIGVTTFNSLKNINHNDKKDESSHFVVESVARAAQRLSAIGHGALMVIERKDSLSEQKRTGTSLDAVMSPDTLCSIFYKGGALHDGAVIINNGRIDSAACVIRMTDRVDIDSSLGTRHRAAIGTSEISDAVVVVVSEETGTISLSIDGNLERDFNYASLRKRLEEILVPEEKKKKTKKTREKKKNTAN